MADTYGIPVSTGWLASPATRAKALLEPYLEAACFGSALDETDARTDGVQRWVHLAPDRSAESISTGRIMGRRCNGVAIHDGLTAYRKFSVQHKLCDVHHLLKLAGVTEATDQQWTVLT